MRFGLILACLVLLASPGALHAQAVVVEPAIYQANPTARATVQIPTGAATPVPLPLPGATRTVQGTATPTPAAGSPTPTVAPVSRTPTPTGAASHGNGQWVTNPQVLELWSSPDADAVSLGRAQPGSYFELTGSGSEKRLYVYYPRIEEFAWVDAAGVGPSTPPPTGYAARPPRISTINLPGRALGYNVRSWPRVAPQTFVREIAHNAQVFVAESVRGDDGEVWYRIGDDEYIAAEGVRLPKGAPRTFAGRWIDVDLAEPTLMTAYEDDRIVYTALALRGTTVDSTPTGLHRVERRVANETMDSATLGIPRDSPRGYYLQDVLFTQYFTSDGAAIHYNYWSTHFGYQGTHGCLGVNYDDALWFWNWASVGTPVNIH
jgi:hypothetical protein